MAHSAIRTLRNGWGRGGGIKVPELGAPLGGGYFVGVSYAQNQLSALILAPKAGQSSAGIQWKTSQTSTAGTTSVKDGWENTLAMEAAGLALHPAANFCRALRIGGFSDWHMPAIDELAAIYTNRDLISGVDSIDADTTVYFSSSESAANTAYALRFSTGESLPILKTTSGGRVRAVRRIPLAGM